MDDGERTTTHNLKHSVYELVQTTEHVGVFLKRLNTYIARNCMLRDSNVKLI